MENCFVFDKDIYWDDSGHLTFWYGDLHPTAFLINKLKRQILNGTPTQSLCLDPLPEFYAAYDVAWRKVEVHCRYVLGNKPGSLPGCVRIPLTAEESKFLITAFDTACRKQHDGLDCLKTINNIRKTKGISPIKPSLTEIVRTAQQAQPAIVRTDDEPTFYVH